MVGLAGLVALGPVSSTGHRTGEGKWVWRRRGGEGAGPRRTRGLGSVGRVVCGEADGVALAGFGALGPVSSTGHRRGEGWICLLCGDGCLRWAAASAASRHLPQRGRKCEGTPGLLLRRTVLPRRRWVLWPPCPPVRPGAGKHGASEGGKGWICLLFGDGCLRWAAASAASRHPRIKCGAGSPGGGGNGKGGLRFRFPVGSGGF